MGRDRGPVTHRGTRATSGQRRSVSECASRPVRFLRLPPPPRPPPRRSDQESRIGADHHHGIWSSRCCRSASRRRTGHGSLPVPPSVRCSVQAPASTRVAAWFKFRIGRVYCASESAPSRHPPRPEQHDGGHDTVMGKPLILPAWLASIPPPRVLYSSFTLIPASCACYRQPHRTSTSPTPTTYPPAGDCRG